MRISVGMLLFALFDSGVAFFLVYYVTKAKFGGEKAIARTLGAVLGIITFIIYFGVIVWFNTYPITAPESVKTTVYLAPIVLSILMLLLVQLSKPMKPIEGTEDEDAGGEEAADGEESSEGEETAEES
ncbi:MAG TPA: hypothetical protein DCP06_04065 [Lachnospiraceae bacterium]|nr:hypothetical protein [Lachnospiraceae bacterium]